MLSELKRIFQARDVITYLISKEIKISYRDKLLGNIWALLSPFLMMLVLYFIFKHIRGSSPVFSLYLFTGLIAWDIFAKSLTASSQILKRKRAYILKFPLPLAIFPIAIVLHKINDLIWGLLAYFIIYCFINFFLAPELTIPLQMLLLPIWTVFFLTFTLGICMILARIGVFFGDMEDIVQVLLRMGFFLNPIFIDMRYIPETLHTYYFLLNPFAGLLIYFRYLVPGGMALTDHYLIPVSYYPLYLACWSMLLFWIGFKSFNLGSRHFSKYL